VKTAIVTGGAKGIGAAVVKRLCREGYSVAINYMTSEEKAEALSSSLVCEGFDVFTVRADVSTPEGADKLINEVIARNGRADVLVNNAGIEYWGLFDSMTDEEITKVVSVDFLAPMLVSKRILPSMLAAHSGRIINISSVWGQQGASCEVAYSAAKAGVIGFTKAHAKELAPSGITVNCICPGATDTDMMKRFSPEETEDICSEIPVGRLCRSEEIAAAVAFFADEENAFVTGQILGVNGGMC